MSAITGAEIRLRARQAEHMEMPGIATALYRAADRVDELEDELARALIGEELDKLRACLREAVRIHAPYTGPGTVGERWLRWGCELLGMERPPAYTGKHAGPVHNHDLDPSCRESLIGDCLRAELVETSAHPLDEWGEDVGPVLWWRFPVDEPPYCGTPIDDDWPGYHTHWTRIVVPADTRAGHERPNAPKLRRSGRR